MPNPCDYCQAELTYEPNSVPYGMTFVDAGFYICENADCPGEFVNCPACDEPITYIDGEDQPCECGMEVAA